jgi:predicted nucleotidyltransferase
VPEGSAKFAELLQLLSRHGVDFIVVGGVGAVLQGAPILTEDLDVVHARTPENIRRILPALAEVKAYYRTRTDRRFEPNETHLESRGHQLLATTLGDLDLLGSVGNRDDNIGYEELFSRTVLMEVAGIRIRVLDLERIIELKEKAGRDKDKAVLPILRQTLALKRQQ